jgi:PEGA domain
MDRFKNVRIVLIVGVVALLAAGVCTAQNATQQTPPVPNKVMGQVNFTPATKVERNAGVWIDGQYVGYVGELKGDKKILLLPGEHEITVRQSGYRDLTQKIIVEPGSVRELALKMDKDPRVQFPEVTSEVKIKVTPDRAAVFLDNAFVGYVHEFGGMGRAMLVSPGKHQLKIALAGYKDFTTDVNLQPKQKFTLKTNLLPASITEADPAIKKQ